MACNSTCPRHLCRFLRWRSKGRGNQSPEAPFSPRYRTDPQPASVLRFFPGCVSACRGFLCPLWPSSQSAFRLLTDQPWVNCQCSPPLWLVGPVLLLPCAWQQCWAFHWAHAASSTRFSCSHRAARASRPFGVRSFALQAATGQRPRASTSFWTDWRINSLRLARQPLRQTRRIS